MKKLHREVSYVTEDGRRFDTEHEAIEHSSELEQEWNSKEYREKLLNFVKFFYLYVYGQKMFLDNDWGRFTIYETFYSEKYSLSSGPELSPFGKQVSSRLSEVGLKLSFHCDVDGRNTKYKVTVIDDKLFKSRSLEKSLSLISKLN